MATKPAFEVRDINTDESVLSRVNPATNKVELTGFGREYLTLKRAGYSYLDGKMVR
jgi:hypothetical protein